MQSEFISDAIKNIKKNKENFIENESTYLKKEHIEKTQQAVENYLKSLEELAYCLVNISIKSFQKERRVS